MLDMPDPPPAGADYATVKRAIEFISTRWRDQPSVEAIADHVGLSPSHFQFVFKRWAGLTPKAFLQAITIERARELLRDSATRARRGLRRRPLRAEPAARPVRHPRGADAGRLPPRRPRRCATASTPRRSARRSSSPRRAAWRASASSTTATARRRSPTCAALAARALRRATTRRPRRSRARAFDPGQWRPDAPLRIVMIGTDFEVRVWETLLCVPMGRATTYSDIARQLGKPTAARAVGAAVGRNPISFVVPCHRVLGRSGALTGYHWGLARKQAIIGWEAGPGRWLTPLSPTFGRAPPCAARRREGLGLAARQRFHGFGRQEPSRCDAFSFLQPRRPERPSTCDSLYAGADRRLLGALPPTLPARAPPGRPLAAGRRGPRPDGGR